VARNEDVVRRFYEAWGREDVPGPVELLDPGVEYVNPTGAIESGTRSGVDAFVAAIEKVFEAWEYWRADIERLEPVGEHVVAVVRYTARGRGSGLEVEGRESALWTLRDGKVTRYEWFHGADDARAAAAAEPH
jgi:ketosteroid isomerase-like protein